MSFLHGEPINDDQCLKKKYSNKVKFDFHLHQTASNNDKTRDKQHELSQAESAVTMTGYDAEEESCSSSKS